MTKNRHAAAPPTSADADRAAFAAQLRRAGSVSAFCHEQPDGDTLGAAVAIALVARRLGIPSEVVAVDPVPPAYRYLEDLVAVRATPTLGPGLAVFCDAASFTRIGPLADSAAEWFARATIANIDHHATNSRFGALNIVDPGAAATCEIVIELLPELGVELDQEIATAVLTGLVRDSYGFSTAATTPRTLRAAASAVGAGASISAISRAILHELPIPQMQLWARLLATMQTAFDERVLYTVLTVDMLQETGTQQHDADGMAEFLYRGREVQVAILFRHLGASTRVSLRTQDGVDAAAIASEFDGGGHARRAGCTVHGSAEEVIPRVLAACQPYLEPGAPTS